jgi:DNA-binding winged helix-turn-helix (wHTH) protein/predicted ATPase
VRIWCFFGEGNGRSCYTEINLTPKELLMSAISIWSFFPFRLDPSTTSLWRHEQLVALPPKPFAVLAYLVAHAGEVVTKEALLDAVWPEVAVTEGVLKGCIRQIRQVLGETAQAPQYIVTVHRRGYRFIASVTAEEPRAIVPEAPPPSLFPADVAIQELQAVPQGPGLVVGRERELAQLHQVWQQVCQGTRQIVFIMGEAGIGKTALVDAFIAQVTPHTLVWHTRGQCIEHYGAGEAYLPLLEAIGRLGRGPDRRRVVEVLRQQASSWLVHLPALVTTAEYRGIQQLVSGVTQPRMLRELAEAVETLTLERPLIMVLEDLHWSDVSTVEWLAYVARRRDRAQLLVLGTYRPVEAIVQTHPVRTTSQELQRQGQSRELTLGLLPETAVAAYLTRRFASIALPTGLVRVLHERTNGNPFFLVTMLDALVERELFYEGEQGWSFPDDLEALKLEVPQSIRQLIERQLEACDPLEQRLLEGASVMGREFVTEAVAAGTEQPTAEAEERFAALARRAQFIQAYGLAAWPDGTVSGHFGFLHDVYRETFYEQMALARRMRLHRQIGRRLEAGYGPQAQEIAAELGEHFVRGRDTERAVTYLLQAGENARLRSALQEAMAHLTQGMEILAAQPQAPARLERELALHFALSLVLSGLKGHAAPETAQAYLRARALCQELGDTVRLFHILGGLRRLYSGRGDLQAARALAAQLHDLAQRSGDPEQVVEAALSQGLVSFFLGDFLVSRDQVKHGLTQDIPRQHYSATLVRGNPRLGCLCYAAMALWGLGYPDQAMQRSQEALRFARHGGRPDSLAFVMQLASQFRQLRREVQAVQGLAAAGMTLTREHGLMNWSGPCTILYGWAIAMQGQHAAGLAHMCQGLDLMRSTQTELMRPYGLALLAQGYKDASQPAAALAVLEEALALVNKTGERWYEAELYRLKGELLLRQAIPAPLGVDHCFSHALQIARSQQAKSWELRVATSVSRLWHHQGKQAEARELLAPIYNGFTEGFETCDLQEAKALLEKLGVGK